MNGFLGATVRLKRCIQQMEDHYFLADRPFVFFITVKTGDGLSLLFGGKLLKPPNAFVTHDEL